MASTALVTLSYTVRVPVSDETASAIERYADGYEEVEEDVVAEAEAELVELLTAHLAGTLTEEQRKKLTYTDGVVDDVEVGRDEG